MMVAPSLCSVFKGTLPSDLYIKYDCEGGRRLMDIDLMVAAEISERIAEQHEEAKKGRKSSGSAKKAVARRNQKREKTMDGKALGQLLKDTMGMDN